MIYYFCQAALISKDEEVVQLSNIVSDLQRQLQAARIDTDKNTLAELVNVRFLIFSPAV